MMEDELRRADERVKNAESRVSFHDDYDDQDHDHDNDHDHVQFSLCSGYVLWGYASTKGKEREREEREERKEREEREEHHRTSWNIMEHHGTSWNIKGYHGTSWNIMEH